MPTPRKHLFRRPLLACAAGLLLASPALASGCGGGFTSITDVNTLRVIGVVADKPYAAPGDEVTFKMTHFDGLVDPKDPNGPKRFVNVLWLGGCFDPAGDQYYGCFASLAETFKSLDPSMPPPPGLIGFGDSFTLKLPDDIISRRPKPANGPHYGVAYVFFAACTGTFAPVKASGTGATGDFPLGCFDDNGNQLGADSFVPGYTQIYSFEDGRVNNNPAVTSMTLDGKAPDDMAETPTIHPCDASDNDRNGVVSCDYQDPYKSCDFVDVDVTVPDDVAEIDPEGMSTDGKPIHEVVWVDYLADKGTIESEAALISDATTGINKDHKTRWLPPNESTRATLWAVVRDARGGETVLQREILVE